MQFIYVLSEWEGLVADSRVLRSAITRTNGLKVPEEDPVESVEEFQEQEIDHIDELQMRNDPFYGLFSSDQSPLTPTSGQSVAQDNNDNGEGSFYEASNSNILELASCFKHEKEVADRRMKVTDELKLVEGLTDIERMKAGLLITKENNLIDYFFTLDQDLRRDLVHHVLD
ncbi:Myb/SANT-like DNA-binding domain protein [Senna tora]|uniref:Myb/SANT-like DNA-binding domain protein n=1 Tax=Senna tora TaxID=362788 RepID=A0A834T1E3_9FABA|nr:Myb/SANT-like DNA-binding domain protein [Senna tora]